MSRFFIDRSEHLPGRECSAVTDEPLFEKLGFVMEGNNEVDSDDREQTLDSGTAGPGHRDPDDRTG